MSNEYEGGQCHVPFTEGQLSIGEVKPNHNMVFFNAQNEEVATLDFNGPGLAFEGIADEAAIVFVNWIAECFAGRLKEERNNERKSLEEELLKLRQGVAANSEYIQGRWDLIGEFQDIIRERIEK